MERSLMDRLLNNFSDVLKEIDQMVARNDVAGIAKMLEATTKEISSRSGVTLDDRDDRNYDHVLHEFLDKLEGVVENEVAVAGVDGVPGQRYYTNEEVQKQIDEQEQEKAEVRRQIEAIERGPETPETLQRHEELKNRYDEISKRIASLQAGKVEGQEFSSLTYIDEDLKALQLERAELLGEKKRLERELTEGSEVETETEVEGVSKEKIQERINELRNGTRVVTEEESEAKLQEGVGNLSNSLKEVRINYTQGYIAGEFEAEGDDPNRNRSIVGSTNPEELLSVIARLDSHPDRDTLISTLGDLDNFISETESNLERITSNNPDNEVLIGYHTRQLELLKNAREEMLKTAETYRREAEQRARRQPVTEEQSNEKLSAGVRQLNESLRQVRINYTQGFIEGEFEAEGDDPNRNKSIVGSTNPEELVNVIAALTANPSRESLDTTLADLDNFIRETESNLERVSRNNPDNEVLKGYHARQLELLKNAREEMQKSVETFDREAEQRTNSQPVTEEQSNEKFGAGVRQLNESLRQVRINYTQGFIEGEFEAEGDDPNRNKSIVASTNPEELVSIIAALSANPNRESIDATLTDLDNFIQETESNLERVTRNNPDNDALKGYHARQLELLKSAREEISKVVETFDREADERAGNNGQDIDPEQAAINEEVAKALEELLNSSDTEYVSMEAINKALEDYRARLNGGEKTEEITKLEEQIAAYEKRENIANTIDGLNLDNDLVEVEESAEAVEEEVAKIDAEIARLQGTIGEDAPRTVAQMQEAMSNRISVLEGRNSRSNIDELRRANNIIEKALKSNPELANLTYEELENSEEFRNLVGSRDFNHLTSMAYAYKDGKVTPESIQQQIDELTKQKEDLLNQKTTRPRTISDIQSELEARIAKKREEYNNQINGHADGVDNDYDELEAEAIQKEIDTLTAQLAELNKLVEENPGIEKLTLAEAKDLTREGEDLPKDFDIEAARKQLDELNNAREPIDETEKAKLEAIIAAFEGLAADKEKFAGKDGLSQEEQNKRKDRIAEIDKRIAEIDKDIEEKFPGAIPYKTESQRIDLKEESHNIGEHIFKAHEIRKELQARDISREEFLEFYQEGYDMTQEQIAQLQEESMKLTDELTIVIFDEDSEKSLVDQLKEAKESGDPEQIKNVYEKIRYNFIKAGREDQLAEIGLDGDHTIETDEDLQKIETFYTLYTESATEGINNIQQSIADLRENLQIFDREIQRIQDEIKTFELAGSSAQELKEQTDRRIQLRKAVLEASMAAKPTPEQQEIIDEWNETSRKFMERREAGRGAGVLKYIDRDGNVQEIDVDTIDMTGYDPKQYRDDMDFLGIPDYKDNIEQLSAYEQTHDPYVFGEKVGRAYDEAEAHEPGSGEAVLASIMADKQKYVETFNGIPNPHKVKYENWKTAGSTLKGMKPVDRDLPAPTRTKNAVENVGRFLGFRVPKFTRLDEHGNKVRDIKGGIGTLLTDLAVAGAVGVSAVTLGPAIPIIGYAAKGIVTAGNLVAARIEYARHKDEIEGNLPVLNQAGKDAREVARKEYHREQGDNRLVAWFKAKAERFMPGRAAKVEQEILEAKQAEYEQAEETRRAALEGNVLTANENQAARQANQELEASSAQTYNDIVRDSNTVDARTADAAIARNAALNSRRPGKGREDVNPNATVERTSKYEKPIGEYEQTQDLDQDAFIQTSNKGVSGITMEQIYTGRKQHVDRTNKVLTAITAGALKFGHTMWKNGFMEKQTVDHPAVTEEQTIHHDAEYNTVETPQYEQQLDTSKTLEELMQANKGRDVNGYYSVSGGNRGGAVRTLGDDKITAAWFNDGSKWGTGISDAQGLSAPELTERLADAALLDSNGVLRQDITVQQLLDCLGCTPQDLTSGKVAFSISDRAWTYGSEMADGIMHNVQVGSTISQELVHDAYDEVVTNVVQEAWTEEISQYAPHLVKEAIKKGLLTGAAVGVAEQLHESFQTTYIDGATPGTPDETTPQANDTFETMAKKLHAIKLKQVTQQKSQEEQHEQQEQDDSDLEL